MLREMLLRSSHDDQCSTASRKCSGFIMTPTKLPAIFKILSQISCVVTAMMVKTTLMPTFRDANSL